MCGVQPIEHHHDNALLMQERWEDPAAEYALPRDAGKAIIVALQASCNSIAEIAYRTDFQA